MFVKCKVCENYFKTKDNLAGHGSKIQNKCLICGKIFMNNVIFTEHFIYQTVKNN